MTRIWLNGDRYNEAYLFDIESGSYRRYETESAVGVTAGNATRLSGTVVATYVAADETGIWLQKGSTRYPVDGKTRAVAQTTWGGLITTLTVERDGLPRLNLKQRTPARWLLRRVDPAWDGLDEFAEDSAAGIAVLLNSAEARESYRRVKVPDAGPWGLVDSGQQ